MIFGKWDERAAYSRQAVPVPATSAGVSVQAATPVTASTVGAEPKPAS
jgi:hypothetical protein